MTRALRSTLPSLLLLLLAVPANPQTIESPSYPVHSGTRVISGVILSAKSGLPLADADVTLNNVGGNPFQAATTTNDSGEFTFPSLADGKYSLHASHRGYVAATFQEHGGYSTAIVTGIDQVTTGLKFTLDPNAVLFGIVSEDSGDPVPQARLALYNIDHASGIEKTHRAGDAATDNLGNYEFPNLAPGNYYLAVIAKPWYATQPQPPVGLFTGKAGNSRPRFPLDLVYPITYYADVTDANSATPIPIAAGERISVNFSLHPLPSIHLTVQVPKSADSRVLSFPQLHQEFFGISEFASPTSFNTLDDRGATTTTVELTGLAPGHYEVELPGQTGSSNRTVSIDAVNGQESLDLTSASSLPDLSGKLRMPEATPPPKNLNIALRPRDGDSWNNARVEPDGSFHMQSIHPGTYDVLINGEASAEGDAYTVSRLTAKGAKTSGSVLTAGSDPIELTVSVSQSSATVSGFAKLKSKPAPGVFVLLVPAHFTADGQLPECDQSDSDGSFEFAHVPPGEYTAIAIQEGWTLDWARPEVLNSYLAKGQRVTISQQAKETKLKDPIEAQPK